MAVFFSPIGNGFQFLDASGNPLNGGLLNTYAAGSSTPTATYTTSAGSVANANPIVMNTDGRPPQEIWFSAGIAYKFLLTDSLSNTLGTYDNLYGIGDPAAPNVASQYFVLSSISGTNTVTAAAVSALSALATGQVFVWIPLNTNTGATTINITPSGGSALGAKNIFWNNAACVGSELRASIPLVMQYDGTQFQITGNGFNAPFLDTHPVVEGSSDSTKKIRFEVDGLTTATTRIITPLDADFTMARQDAAQTFTGVQTFTSPVFNTQVSGSAIATQANQETATSAVTIVTPAFQQFHPSALKAAVRFNAAGTIAYNFNITSITDNGAGSWDVVIATDFSGAANYAAAGMVGKGGGPLVLDVRATSAAGTYSIESDHSGTGVATDPDTPNEIHVIFTGDQ